MGKLSSLLWGAALGAGLMYFMDPQSGNRRKAMVRDRVYRTRGQADDAMNMAVSDLRNRVRGLLAEGMAMVSEEGASDQVMEQRIRSRLGFLSRHPGAIQVSVQNHRAILSGDILADEVDGLVKAISGMRGIQDVQNNLRVHQEAGNIPQLQGEGWMPGQDGLNQWSPSTRLLAGLGAGYLFVYGMGRGGLIGTLAQAGSLVLGARVFTNMDMRSMTGTNQEGGGTIRVRKSIHINAPVDEVYQLWSNFENFQRFMANIESIRNAGGNRSHWVVKGPAGSKVEFDAVMTQNQPDELIAWETTPDSQVKHHGQVRFRSTGGNGTQVNVNLSYTPPAGVVGAAVASLFGKDPKAEMDEDLARMKSLLEHGKTTAGNQKVTREQVMPVTGSQQETRGRQGGSQRGRGGQQSGNQQTGGDAMETFGSTDLDDTGEDAPLAPTDI